MQIKTWSTAALVAIVMMGGLTSPSLAQNAARRGVPARPNAVMNRMAQLKLTETQQEKIRQINIAAQEKRLAIAKDTKLTPEKRRTALQEIAKGTREKIQAVLTPEQRKQWQQMQLERPVAGTAAPMAAVRGLDLTEDQQKKMRAISQEFQPKFLKIRQSTSLTPQQKAEQTRNLRRQQQDRIMAILTPEQREKAKARLNAQPPRRAPRANATR